MVNMRKHRRPARGKVKMVAQRTLKQRINCSGIALHCGLNVTVTLSPGEVDSGIVFRRTDIAGGGVLIPARWDHVTDTRMCSTLGDQDGVTISTVEHLMAALAGMEIDNAVVEVNGPEIPIMDGSAAPFVLLIECAGVFDQDRPRRVIRVLKPISVDDGERYASLAPGNGFTVGLDIDFNSRAVSRQRISVELGNGAFNRELARARTFGFLHEVEELRAAGLARGGSLDNAVVVNGDKVLNEGGLRYDDEFVRHKALDAIGDLYLAGAPLRGHFYGRCSGHGTNNALLRALFADAEAWNYDEMRIDETEAAIGPGIWTDPRARVAAIPATA